MTSKYFFAAIGLLALAACSNPEPNPEMIPVVIVAGEGDTPDYDPTVIPEFTYGVPVYAGQKAADAESYPQGNPDLNPNENEWSTTVRVVYNGAAATVSGAAEAGITATVTGANVDLALGQTRGVRIIASGSSDCGSLRLTGSYKHLLELSDLTLTATDRPAINDQIKKRVFLIVRGHNRLTDGENYLTSSEQRTGFWKSADAIATALSATAICSLIRALRWPLPMQARMPFISKARAPLTISEALKSPAATFLPPLRLRPAKR